MNGQTNGSPGTTSPLRIYDAHSVTFPGPTPQAEDYEEFHDLDTAIVIDNGIISYSMGNILTFICRFESTSRRMGTGDVAATCD